MVSLINNEIKLIVDEFIGSLISSVLESHFLVSFNVFSLSATKIYSLRNPQPFPCFQEILYISQNIVCFFSVRFLGKVNSILENSF